MRGPDKHPQHWPIPAAMRQAGRVGLVWLLLAIAVCAGLIYLAFWLEPHHVSKDGRRFLASGQWISDHGEPTSRRREVWISVTDGSQHLQIDVKRRMHHDVSHWTIEGKSPDPPPRRAVYVLRSMTAEGTIQRMTVQVPSTSRAVATLDQVLATR